MPMSEHRWPNVVAMLLDQAERLGDAPFLWAKHDDDWRPLSWRQVSETAMALAAGLRAAGIASGERVALVAENRPEWLIADIAIMAAGAITVPAYTTNTSDDHRHILGNSGAAACRAQGVYHESHRGASAAAAGEGLSVRRYGMVSTAWQAAGRSGGAGRGPGGRITAGRTCCAGSGNQDISSAPQPSPGPGGACG